MELLRWRGRADAVRGQRRALPRPSGGREALLQCCAPDGTWEPSAHHTPVLSSWDYESLRHDQQEIINENNTHQVTHQPSVTLQVLPQACCTQRRASSPIE